MNRGDFLFLLLFVFPVIIVSIIHPQWKREADYLVWEEQGEE